jgi:sulfide dehydrogenase cytochrome subunit
MNATRIAISAAVIFTLMGSPWSGTAGAAGPADAPAGAAACSGCHPATKYVDTTVPADIVTAMQAFKSGQLPSTVMDRISKGFSDDEIKAIAAWYGAQKD